MDADTLQSLCVDLETMYGLKQSKRMSVIEKVCMFLYTLALGASNMKVHERFQHSSVTVSRYFKWALGTVCLLAVDFIKPVDPEFSTTPMEIAINPRYMPHFKVKNALSMLLNNWKGYKQIFVLHLNWFVNFFFVELYWIDWWKHVRACVSQENQIPFIGRKDVLAQNIMAACSFDMQFIFI